MGINFTASLLTYNDFAIRAASFEGRELDSNITECLISLSAWSTLGKKFNCWPLSGLNLQFYSWRLSSWIVTMILRMNVKTRCTNHRLFAQRLERMVLGILMTSLAFHPNEVLGTMSDYCMDLQINRTSSPNRTHPTKTNYKALSTVESILGVIKPSKHREQPICLGRPIVLTLCNHLYDFFFISGIGWVA